MSQEKSRPLNEGMEKKGGVGKPPQSPKPQIKPAPQKPTKSSGSSSQKSN